MALGEAAHEVLFIAYLTQETVNLNLLPATIHEDNFAALQQSHNNVGRGRLKHVELRKLKIREYVRENLLKVTQIKSTDQVADINLN